MLQPEVSSFLILIFEGTPRRLEVQIRSFVLYLWYNEY